MLVKEFVNINKSKNGYIVIIGEKSYWVDEKELMIFSEKEVKDFGSYWAWGRDRLWLIID